MKKNSFTYFIIGICVVIILSVFIISFVNIKKTNVNNELMSSKITDECTEEWEKYNKIDYNIKETNSSKKKVSPNAKIVLRNYYKSCGHIDTIESIADENVINMNEEELEKKYIDYEIEGFSNDEIKLYKELDGLCDKHYLLIEENGYVEIYKVENNGDKKFIYKTNISSEYLTEMDKIQLKEGIYVYGEDELNKTLEDFE